MKVLAKDVKWEYSAPDIPDSHWIEQGHDEHYVEGMNLFLDRLKDTTSKMRRGDSIDCITLGCKYADDGARFSTALHDAPSADSTLARVDGCNPTLQWIQRQGYIAGVESPANEKGDGYVDEGIKDKRIQ